MEKTALPETMEGAGLRLVRFHPDQARALYEVVALNRTRLEPYLPWVPEVLSVDDEEGALRRARQQWDARNEFSYVIFAGASAVILGAIGVHHLVWEQDTCEIGYFVTAGAEGQGVVSRSVALLEKVLFSLGFYRIEIRPRADNTRSVAVAERCGYRLDGCLRGSLIQGGLRRDMLVFSKLRGEPEAETGPPWEPRHTTLAQVSSDSTVSA